MLLGYCAVPVDIDTPWHWVKVVQVIGKGLQFGFIAKTDPVKNALPAGGGACARRGCECYFYRSGEVIISFGGEVYG